MSLCVRPSLKSVGLKGFYNQFKKDKGSAISEEDNPFPMPCHPF